jgi:hypothetical protein
MVNSFVSCIQNLFIAALAALLHRNPASSNAYDDRSVAQKSIKILASWNGNIQQTILTL